MQIVLLVNEFTIIKLSKALRKYNFNDTMYLGTNPLAIKDDFLLFIPIVAFLMFLQKDNSIKGHWQKLIQIKSMSNGCEI